MDKNLRWPLLATWCIILVCVGLLCRSERRLALSINGFTTEAAEALSVGDMSDVCFNQVPSDYMTIAWDEARGGYTWRVATKYVDADSLCYYKINGVNPNSYIVGKGCQIDVQHRGRTTKVSYDALREAVKGVDNKYVALGVLLAKTTGDATWTEARGLRSFIYDDDGEWRLIILDRCTRMTNGEGGQVGYCTEGATADISPERADYCKVQFFNVKTNAYRLGHVDKNTFHVGDINYTMKPMISTTEWGAGHVLVHHENGHHVVRFPKAITYVERLDTLFGDVDGNSALLTLHQYDGSLPFEGNVYVPEFSRKVAQDVCNIRLVGDSLMVGQTLVESSWSLLPAKQSLTMAAGRSTLEMEATIVGVPFVMSYLWLTLAVFLIIYMVYPYLVDTRRAMGSSGVDTWSSYLPAYFRVIFSVALAYCLCRVMIGFKLSYTFPYFDKITGIVPVCCALVLLLVYQLSIVLNHDFLVVKYRRGAGGKQRRWVAFGVAAFCLVLCGAAFVAMDRGYNAAMLRAYLPGETWSLNPLVWLKSQPINDLHRSVPFMLLLANGVALGVLLLLNAVKSLPFNYTKVQRRIDAYVDAYETRSHKRINRYHGRTSVRRAMDNATSIFFFLLRYALAPCLVILAISITPGNFATAFITFGVIVGYSYTLSCINFNQNRFIVFCEMGATSLIYLIAAIAFGDKGYLTNYFGLFLMFILMYFMMLKSKTAYSLDAIERKAELREQKSIPVLAALLLVVALVMPWAIGAVKNPDNVSYDRMDRRISMFAQYDQYINSGYRYAVSDVEFMTVMMHSMFNTDGSDPLNNDRHALHPSVSTGQSPVVLNDLSMPCAFIGGYGWMAYIPYLGLVAVLLYTVLYFSLRPTIHQRDLIYLDHRAQWRMLTVFMWFGTTLYLYLSYIGQLPFTGRLNPGMGVDSVGEALETSILLAFMTATRCFHRRER